MCQKKTLPFFQVLKCHHSVHLPVKTWNLYVEEEPFTHLVRLHSSSTLVCAALLWFLLQWVSSQSHMFEVNLCMPIIIHVYQYIRVSPICFWLAFGFCFFFFDHWSVLLLLSNVHVSKFYWPFICPCKIQYVAPFPD